MKYVALIAIIFGFVFAEGENCSDPIVVPGLNFSDCVRSTGDYVNDYDVLATDAGLTAQYGPDVVYSFTPGTDIPDVAVTAVPIGSWDISLYIFTDCASPVALTGVDEHGAGAPEALTGLTLSAGVTYYFVVDGETEEDSGHYCFNISSSVSAEEKEASLRTSLSVSPTFTSGNTDIEFSISGNSYVNLVVYNALGQPVRTLKAGNLSAGTYSVAWNGLDNHGALLPPGVYFVKLSTGSAESVKKLVLIR